MDKDTGLEANEHEGDRSTEKGTAAGRLARILTLACPPLILLGGAVYFCLCHVHFYRQRDLGIRVDLNLRIYKVTNPDLRSVKKGDRLEALRLPDGREFRPMSSYHWIHQLRKLEYGRPYRLRFARGTKTFWQTLKPERPAVLPKFLYSLGSLAVLLTLCGLMWFRRRHVPGVPLMIVVVFLGFQVTYVLTNLESVLTSATLFSVFLLSDLVAMPLMLHLFMFFPDRWGPVLRHPRRVWLVYLPQAALAATVVAAFYALCHQPTQAHQALMLKLGTYGLSIGSSVYALAATGVMIHRFLLSPPKRRKQFMWFLYGLCMAVVLSLFFYILKWNSTSYHWVFGGSDFLLPIYALLAFTVASTFISFRLIDVDRIVNRSLVYAVLSTAVALTYLAAAGLLGWLVSELVGKTSTGHTAMATVVAMAAFFPLRRVVQKNVDRLFFRQKASYAGTLRRVSNDLVTVLNLHNLLGTLLELLLRDMRVRHGSVVLFRKDGSPELYRTAGRPHIPDLTRFSRGGMLRLRQLRALAVDRTVLLKSQVPRVVPSRKVEDALNTFGSLEAEAIVFMAFKGELLGLIALGPRRGQALYSRDEVELLLAVAPQVCVAIHNARTYTVIERLNKDLGEKQREILALQASLKEENVYLKEAVRRAAYGGEVVGRSPAFRKVMDDAVKAASTDATVLITGETGTGKELIARAIHENSPRADKPLVTINCAAIPEGLLESEVFGHVKGAFTGAATARKGKFMVAHRGTLFLDEVGDMPLSIQAKLLRVLEDKKVVPVGGTESTEVDVRIVAATNRNLEDMVHQGTFRQDLFYRLDVIPLKVPPLRARPGDTRLLAEYFLGGAARRLGKNVTGFSREAVHRLQTYPWPGNVRELANVVERAVVLAEGSVLHDEVVLSHTATPGVRTATPTPTPAPGAPPVPASSFFQKPFHDAVEDFKRTLLQAVVSECGGNKAEAARRLGLQRTYLYRLMKQLDVEQA